MSFQALWRIWILITRSLHTLNLDANNEGYKPNFWKDGDSRIYDAAVNQLSAHPWHDPIEFDATLKQAFTMGDGYFIKGDGERFDLNFRWFLRRLNRILYGNKSDDIGIPMFCVLERSIEGRWHFHTLTDRPPGISRIQLAYAVRLCWMQIPFAHERILFGPVDQNWKRYLLKPSQKPGNFADAFRWTNNNLGYCEPITLPIVKRLHDAGDQWDPHGKLNGHWQLVLNEARYLALNGQGLEVGTGTALESERHWVL